ncbi:hypothetical protein ACFO5X_07375 [Seohaeicola nanhaiensis]|uniref:Uncharacterized protein n=1 Tax=Seohaeicola nanhaiensis TaxID=1387282 RepID=A0ABV9KEF4_9RHOB
MFKVFEKDDTPPALIAAQREFIIGTVCTATRAARGSFGLETHATLAALVGKSVNFLEAYDADATADYLEAIAHSLRGEDTDAALEAAFRRIAAAAHLTHTRMMGAA